MMARKAGRRIPVGFIPNGSGNDICYNLEIRSVETAIDLIIRGQIIKTDLIKSLLDYETEEELFEAADKEGSSVKVVDHLRYCLNNIQYGLLANVAKNA